MWGIGSGHISKVNTVVQLFTIVETIISTSSNARFFSLPIDIAVGEENRHIVMAVGRNSDNQIVEIYDSFEKTWKTMGHLSRKVNALYSSDNAFGQ